MNQLDICKIKNFQQLATLCYVKNNGDTLMIFKKESKNNEHNGKFNGLGGKIGPSESIEQCLFREVFEESSIVILNPELTGVLLFPDFTEYCDWLVFVYVAEAPTREFVESGEGSLSWVRDEEILSLSLWEGDREFLPLVLAKEKFFGRFNYIGSRLQDFKLIKV